MPWVLENTEILSDRFHYRSHKCCSLYDPDTYPGCDGLHTSGAESINRSIADSRKHIRYLSGKKLLPLIYAGAILLNLRAHVREGSNVMDVEDIDVVCVFDNLIPRRCLRCRSRDNQAGSCGKPYIMPF